MYTHLLVPLDGSQRAERAVSVAERIASMSAARGGSSRITLMQSASVALPLGAPYASTTLSPEAIVQTEAQASAYLTRIAGWPLLSGLQVETLVVASPVALAILDTAHETNADLIVLCSHGRTGASRWVLGSVAEHVARQSPVPVLVLREQGPIPAHPHPDPEQPLRILVPLDGSPFAEAALVPAAELILALAGPSSGPQQAEWASMASLHLTLALPPIDMNRENMPDSLALEGAQAYLRRTANHLRDTYPQLQVTWSVTSDLDVAAALLRVAEIGEDAEGAGPASRCDVIAIATHGRSGIARWALGSITERVLHGTKLPLLIVRPAAVAKQTHPGVQLTQVTPATMHRDRGAIDVPTAPLF